MNNEERMMVLKLLEEGKIKAEDAMKLLDALKDGGIDNFIGENSERLKSAFAEVKVKAGEFAKKVEPSVNDAKEKIEETYKKFEPTLKDVSEKMKKAACEFTDQLAKKFSNNDCNCGCGCGCDGSKKENTESTQNVQKTEDKENLEDKENKE